MSNDCLIHLFTFLLKTNSFDMTAELGFDIWKRCQFFSSEKVLWVTCVGIADNIVMYLHTNNDCTSEKEIPDNGSLMRHLQLDKASAVLLNRVQLFVWIS